MAETCVELSPSAKRRKRANAVKTHLWQLVHDSCLAPRTPKRPRPSSSAASVSGPQFTPDKIAKQNPVYTRCELLSFRTSVLDLKAEVVTALRPDAPPFWPTGGYTHDWTTTAEWMPPSHDAVDPGWYNGVPSASESPAGEEHFGKQTEFQRMSEAVSVKHDLASCCSKCAAVLVLLAEDTSDKVMVDRCFCGEVVCRLCNKLCDDCSCDFPAITSSTCSFCRREFTDCEDELACRCCWKPLAQCRCEMPLLFERLGFCEALGIEDATHNFEPAVHWLMDNDAPCGKCGHILKDEQQVRCEADECAEEEMHGGPLFYHLSCMVQVGDGLVCCPCAAAGKVPFIDTSDDGASDESDTEIET